MSEIRATTISDLAGTGPATLTGQYAAKAWVNFNGTGTVAIRESGNVSSITDNGTADYTLNFTTAQVDANYAVNGIIGLASGLNFNFSALVSPTAFSYTASSVRVRTPYANGEGVMVAFDYDTVCFSITR